LKSKFLLLVLAPLLALLLPMAAMGQVAPDRVPTVRTGPDYKYSAFVGWGYTSLNQVNQSRSGLQGVAASVTRDFSDHFGVTIDGGHYAWSVTSSNTGNPSVDLVMAGPVVHGDLYGKLSGFAHALLGGAHTGGVAIQPGVSFAGGFGVGVDYAKSPRFSFRLYGDDIASSFTLVPYQRGFSPHMRWNARAGVGVVYHF
jgi:hypothetical protein